MSFHIPKDFDELSFGSNFRHYCLLLILREEFDDGYANPVDEANDAVAIA